MALLYLDLDRFKPVNDSLGHAVGDALLKAVADRLRVTVRDTDTVARIGGDEFAVVQVGIGEPAEAGLLARRLTKAVAAPYEIGLNRIVIGTSSGIALAPHNGTDPNRLLKMADEALYQCKAQERGGYRFFDARSVFEPQVSAA
jgi:diguanylate cyclase (GGDEF)-like protein